MKESNAKLKSLIVKIAQKMKRPKSMIRFQNENPSLFPKEYK